MSSVTKADDAIWPTSDRKVRKYKNQFNTYGLMPGLLETCPGATVGEGGCCQIKPGRKQPTCYVMGLLSAYKGVKNILWHNTQLLKQADKASKEALLVREFQRFINAETKRTQRTGEKPWLHYRLHWSGDFFDYDYAEAAALAMRKFPSIHFWTYTRSFFVLPMLQYVKNLTLYLSLDADNITTGLDRYYHFRTLFKPGNLQICYLSPTKENDFEQRWSKAKQCAPGRGCWDSKPMALANCPVDLKQLPLEGGCATCQKCIGLCPKKDNLPPKKNECGRCQHCQLTQHHSRPIWFQP